MDGRLSYTDQRHVSERKRRDYVGVRASSGHLLFDTQIQDQVSVIQDDGCLMIVMVTKFRRLEA